MIGYWIHKLWDYSKMMSLDLRGFILGMVIFVMGCLISLFLFGCVSVDDGSTSISKQDEIIRWEEGTGPKLPTKTTNHVRLGTVYFAYNQSVIGETEQVKLQAIMQEFSKYPDQNLLIEGHCDERGSEEYNRALGERRALAVKEFLVNRGIDPNRIYTISYGEERPAVTGKNEEAYRLNRRAEILLTPTKDLADSR